MSNLDQEVQQARQQFILTAGAVACFLFLPILFLPISITSGMQMTPPLWQKVKRN